MTISYASLLALNPDMFPNTKPENEKLEGNELSAYRLMYMFENVGYAVSFMNEVNRQLENDNKEEYVEIYRSLFVQIRERFR